MVAREKTHRVRLFEGKDDGLKDRAVQQLVSELLEPESRDFDFEIIDGSSATAERVISAAATPPFSSEVRVVLVRRVNQMPQDEQISLASVLPRIPDSTRLILTVPAPEMKDGKARRGAVPAKELSAAVKEVGCIQRFEHARKDGVVKLAVELLSLEGKTARPDVLTILIERVGGDYGILRTEIRKLADYVGERKEITVDDVNSVTAETLEEKIFSLIDAIGERKAGKALFLTREYFESAARPEAAAPKLIIMIARHIRLLWQVKLLQESRVKLTTGLKDLPDDLRNRIPRTGNVMELVRRQQWLSGKLSTQARNFTTADLSLALDLLADADLSLKGIDNSISDERTIIELLIARLCRA
jgi:DNA polymerase III subunit delta